MRKSASLLAGIAMIAALGCSTGATEETFSATLARGNEVAGGVTGTPGTYSNADGSQSATGSMTLTSNGVGVATYKLTVNGLTDITQAHIHSTTAGLNSTQSGAVAVWLFDGPATGGAAAFNGVLGCNAGVSCTSSFNQVQIAAASTLSYDQLISNIRNKLAYVNVHTTANGLGAIRGNF